MKEPASATTRPAAGALVETADNGRVAVDLALAARDGGEPFDVVLLDMQMPVLDGYEAATMLRSSGYAMPIVALTAHVMAADQDKCLKAGCDDYATKPIDRKTLIAVARKYAAHRKQPAGSRLTVQRGDRAAPAQNVHHACPDHGSSPSESSRW